MQDKNESAKMGCERKRREETRCLESEGKE